MATIVIAVSDLLFQSRIEAAARAADSSPAIADTRERLKDALNASPAAVVVDVHETAFSAIEAIGDAHTAGARVLAFGRHTAPADLRAARAAGAEIVVPRSDLVEKLPQLLERLLGVTEPEST